MNRIVFISTATICYLFAPPFAGTKDTQAAPIYGQVSPAQPIGAFTSTNRLDYPKAADSFLLSVSQPVTVRSISVIGGYTATMPPPITPPLDSLPNDDFRVVFLSDSGGSPGSPVAGGDFAIGAAAQRIPTGGLLLNGNQFPIRYTLDLGVGITLNPNAVYWISIANDPGPQFGWQWARASGIYDQYTAETENDVSAGPWNTFATGGMYFSLDDANVPEPACSTIVMMTLFALISIRAPVHRQTLNCI